MAHFLVKNVGSMALRDRWSGAEARFPSATMALDREPPLVAAGERDLAQKCVNSAQRDFSGQNRCNQLALGFSPVEV
jgi:hypothetical protein